MISRWLFLAGVGILTALVAAGTVRTGQLLLRWVPPRNLLLTLPENLSRIAVTGLCVALGAAWGPGAGPLGWRPAFILKDAVLGIAIGAVLAVVLSVGGQSVVRRWGVEVHKTGVLRAIVPAHRGEWPGVLLALLPAAALEELLFRSLPLGGLGWLIPAWWLMWPLALLFGLLHWPQGGWGVVGATVAATVLSVLFIGTGGIWAPLAAHYTMNALQLALAYRSGLKPSRQRPASLPENDG